MPDKPRPNPEETKQLGYLKTNYQIQIKLIADEIKNSHQASKSKK
jgi:hypothetical protein